MPWDRELYVLEEAIRRLGAEYDTFFYGSASKPPLQSRKHVEQMIRQLGGMAADSAADRFRFSTLQGRYNALCDRWERLQEEKEAGRRPGLYGHFTDGGRTPPPPRPPPPPAATPPPLNAAPPASVSEGRGGTSSAPTDKDLFERYVSAKKAAGENVGGYRYEQFMESLEKERRKLQERLGGEDIVFDVAEREGRVRLVARRREAKGSKET